MTDAIHAAHGEILPLDWIYEHCSRILGMMTEYEPEQWENGITINEWVSSLVDTYYVDLARWLSLHVEFFGFVDEAVEKFGHSGDGVSGDIENGQRKLLEQIAYAMLSAVREQAEAAEIEE